MTTWRRPSEAQGYVKVILRCGASLVFGRTELAVLADAAEYGLEWVTLRDTHGDTGRIRMADVVYFGDCSPGAIAVFEAEEEDRLAHERLHGSEDE